MIIGQLYGGRLELVQIRPLIKEGLCHPSKKITKLIIIHTLVRESMEKLMIS